MRRYAIILSFLTFTAAAGTSTCGEAEPQSNGPAPTPITHALASVAQESTPKHDALTTTLDALEKVLGGRDAFAAIPALKYKFQVVAGGKVGAERSVLFDKAGKRARSESRGKEGEALAFAVDYGKAKTILRRDDVVQDGEAAQGSKDKLRRTLALDINYAVLPWRLRDKDLEVVDQGTVEFEQKSFRSLKATYAATAPDLAGDSFELLLDPASSLPIVLKVRFKSMRPEQQPLVFVLEEWVELKGVKFPTRLRGASQTIRFEDLASVPTIDPKLFDGL